ncbi:MAG: hypothetical protein V3R87_05445 [Dehalococcoidia bacterium]
MGQVWAELRYGVSGQGVALCKSDNPYLLRVFKRCVLEKAGQLANESEAVDEVIHLHDNLELRRLREVLSLVVPDEEHD